MDNENKELQNGPTEAELEEKVRQDVSEKIRDAAAELEDEIAEAEEVVAEEDLMEIAEEEEPVVIGYDEDGNPIFAEIEEDPIPEPRWISVKLRNMILSLVGAAAIGALLFFVAAQVPGWLRAGGSSVVPATPVNMDGKKVLSVSGEELSDKELECYIYRAAVEYFNENRGVAPAITEFDWKTKGEDGKTAEEIVKERALEMATEDILLMRAGKKADIEWDEDMEYQWVEARNYIMNKQYGEALVEADIVAQGYRDVDVYKRMAVRQSYLEALAKDREENSKNYYPKDMSKLDKYASKKGATVKHILIALDQEETLATEEETEVPAETVDKKALAEEVLAKAKKGEDFDDLIEEYGEDPGQPEEGYTFGPGEMMEEFEKAAFELELNEISDIVETPYGYHIILRLPGDYDLVNYWKESAKIKTKDKVLKEISIAEIVKRSEESKADFEALYEEYQSENSMY